MDPLPSIGAERCIEIHLLSTEALYLLLRLDSLPLASDRLGGEPLN